ncbi:MAG TPA: Hsp20/alpha crystallin family protein [Ferruginibacter sp.]|nr:Hsp20/alpha crystallin family protein [Ferruginibacter sp.]
MTLVKVNNPLSRSFDGLMKDFFEDFPVTMGKSLRENVLHFPPVNITEKENAYLLEIAAPGYEKQDFQVKVDDKMLHISVEKTDEKTETTDKMVRREFSKRSFKRSFTIDEKIDAQNISARYENGILKLELPRKTEAKASATEISVQ